MRSHFHGFIDKSAWILIVPSLLILLLIDPSLLKTLLSWTTFSVTIAGVSIIISRIIFPQIDLSDLVERAKSGDISAAIVAGSLIFFVAILFYSIIFWAKA